MGVPSFISCGSNMSGCVGLHRGNSREQQQPWIVRHFSIATLSGPKSIRPDSQYIFPRNKNPK